MTVDQSAGQAVVTVAARRHRQAGLGPLRDALPAARSAARTTPRSSRPWSSQPGQTTATLHDPGRQSQHARASQDGRARPVQPLPDRHDRPTHAILTITGGTLPVVERNPVNPLDLSATPPVTDPLTGASPFIDLRYGVAAVAQRRLAHRHPAEAAAMGVIATQPDVMRYGNWSGPNPGCRSPTTSTAPPSRNPGTVPELSTYYLVNGRARIALPSLLRSRLARRRLPQVDPEPGLGDRRLPGDRVPGDGLADHHRLPEPSRARRSACTSFTTPSTPCPSFPAWWSTWMPAPPMRSPPRTAASLLRRAGVAEIQGFFLNSTHFDWTTRRDQLRRGDLAADRRQALRRSTPPRTAGGRSSPATASSTATRSCATRPTAACGPKPTFDTGYRERRRLRLDRLSRQVRRASASPGAPPTGHLLAQAGRQPGPARRLRRPLTRAGSAPG